MIEITNLDTTELRQLLLSNDRQSFDYDSRPGSYYTEIGDDLPNQKELISTIRNLKNRQHITKPKTPKYYQFVMISRLASCKILEHSVKGGNIEVMGMLLGNIIGDTFIIFDCFELPVEGTETTVNAHLESYEFMVQYYNEMVEKSDTMNEEKLNIIGWYHSHPGYDCWLSSIDMQTQSLNQLHQDPYLAIVIDPHKSVQNQKIRLESFRTYQNGNGNTEFYQLNTAMFDSSLNNFKPPYKLEINPISEESRKQERKLLHKLSETITEFHNLKDVELLNENLGTESKVAEQVGGELTAPATIMGSSHTFELSTRGIETPNREDQNVTRSTNAMPFLSSSDPIRSNSVSSIGTSSDIDMEDRNFSALDSIASSVHTATENHGFSVQNRNFEPTHETLPRRPELMPRIESSRYGLIFQNKERPLRSNLGLPPDNIQDSLDNKHMDDHHETLEQEYESYKQKLLQHKVRQYYRLRMYKELFSLPKN
ncbi:COP9 signalosome complex subunit 5 [Nakaseomyces bracarensis]|uniref:COP9 signalosome complex subunit 5 n=1 Tax=Nakaseomyces bracarensis TaxID=273131 RepID=A0ABR4NN64_9SACH